MSDDRAKVAPDADDRGQAENKNKSSTDHTKTQDLVKAGRDDIDPGAGTE